MIKLVLSPVFQTYEVPPTAVKVELSPTQMEDVPVIEGVGRELAVIVAHSVTVPLGVPEI